VLLIQKTILVGCKKVVLNISLVQRVFKIVISRNFVSIAWQTGYNFQKRTRMKFVCAIIRLIARV